MTKLRLPPTAATALSHVSRLGCDNGGMTYTMTIQSSRYASTRLRFIGPIYAALRLRVDGREGALSSKDVSTRPASGNIIESGFSSAPQRRLAGGIINLQNRLGHCRSGAVSIKLPKTHTNVTISFSHAVVTCWFLLPTPRC